MRLFKDTRGILWNQTSLSREGQKESLIYDYNNIEGKITGCWLVNEESIFFLILLCQAGKMDPCKIKD